MKIIEWFKSLFKKSKSECPEINKNVTDFAKYEIKADNALEIKPPVKKKKRGRPRKKKVEQK